MHGTGYARRPTKRHLRRRGFSTFVREDQVFQAPPTRYTKHAVNEARCPINEARPFSRKLNHNYDLDAAADGQKADEMDEDSDGGFFEEVGGVRIDMP